MVLKTIKNRSRRGGAFKMPKPIFKMPSMNSLKISDKLKNVKMPATNLKMSEKLKNIKMPSNPFTKKNKAASSIAAVPVVIQPAATIVSTATLVPTVSNPTGVRNFACSCQRSNPSDKYACDCQKSTSGGRKLKTRRGGRRKLRTHH